jgi:hypothetical protein
MPTPSPRIDVTVGKHAGAPRKHRISIKVRDAIRLMCEQALTRQQAAKAVGLADHSLYVALKKPQVLEFLKECMADLRKSAAAAALGQVAKLSSGAASENVRLQASQFLLGIEGIRPAEKVEHDHLHLHLPGYVLDPGQPDTRRPDYLRDVTPAGPQIADLASGPVEAAESRAPVPQAARGTAEKAGRVGVDSGDE